MASVSTWNRNNQPCDNNRISFEIRKHSDCKLTVQSFSEFENLKYNPIASSPVIDNNFKFAACRTIHDGYEFERIDKLRNTVSYSRENEPIFLRVCITSQNGDNCSVCDKCSRSILGLISENENPNGYGFDVCDETLLGIRANLDDLKNGVEIEGDCDVTNLQGHFNESGEYQIPYWLKILIENSK